MQCTKVREIFVSYLDDDVRFTERICVEVHVARCYGCREELEELRSLQEHCRAALSHPGIKNGFSALKARISEQEALACSRGVWGAENWRNAAAKFAAAAIVLVVLGLSPPFLRHTRSLAGRVREVIGESGPSATGVPLLSAPFVEHKIEIENAFRLADHGNGPESADTPHSIPNPRT